MSVLQCASVALKATVRDLENGECSRLYALRQAQMMETLECLLQMGGYLHTMVNIWSTYVTPLFSSPFYSSLSVS